MTKKESLQLFETKKVRTIWDDEQEKWYFAIVDVVAVLTGSADPQAYWRKLKQRLKEEGNQTVTDCHALKMRLPMATNHFICGYPSSCRRSIRKRWRCLPWHHPLACR